MPPPTAAASGGHILPPAKESLLSLDGLALLLAGLGGALAREAGLVLDVAAPGLPAPLLPLPAPGLYTHTGEANSLRLSRFAQWLPHFYPSPREQKRKVCVGANDKVKT